MRPTYHVVISASVSAGFWYLCKSWPGALACFLSGIFIDIDHHFDYYIAKKKFPFRYADLWDFCVKDKDSKIYVFLHSYELLFSFWFIIYYWRLDEVWVGIALGITIHILVDEVFNPLKSFSYFLIYRIIQGFDRKKLFREEVYKKRYG